MSKEYQEFFDAQINKVEFYDLSVDEAAAKGWNAARDTIVRFLNQHKFYSREEGTIIDADIINYIEKL